MTSKLANAVDVQVGKRIRALRQIAGLSQATLGDQLGVTFQQIQKYEVGKNRIGAGRLFEIAQILQVSITSLFPDSSPSPAPGPAGERSDILDDLSRNTELWLLNKAFLRIRNPKVRREVIAFVRQIASDPTTAD